MDPKTFWRTGATRNYILITCYNAIRITPKALKNYRVVDGLRSSVLGTHRSAISTLSIIYLYINFVVGSELRILQGLKMVEHWPCQVQKI